MKSIKYYNQTEKEALEYTSKLVDFGVTLVVYAALNELLNAHLILRRSALYKTIIKKRANEALRQRDRKVRELKDLVMHKGFAETYWDSVIDICEKDISNLKEEIKRTIEEAGVDNAELYAEAETTRLLLMIAKLHFEEVIRNTTNMFRAKNLADMRNLNLFEVFHEFYIDGIYKLWDTICDDIYGKKHTQVKLENERTKAAFDILLDKFSTGEYIQGCFKIATEEYPEFSSSKVVVEN